MMPRKNAITGELHNRMLPDNFFKQIYKPKFLDYVKLIPKKLMYQYVMKLNMSYGFYMLALLTAFICIPRLYYVYKRRNDSSKWAHQYLYKTNENVRVYYPCQHEANLNPHNIYDSNAKMWSTDPFFEYKLGPKRSWEALENPSECIYRFKVDIDKHPKKENLLAKPIAQN